MEAIHFALICVVLFLLYKLATRNHGYWRKKNVPFFKPVPFFGSTYDLVLKLKSDTDSAEDLYKFFGNRRVGGMWLMTQPVLMIRDPVLMKKITVKDFNHFMNRNIIIDEELDPIFAKNLFTIKDKRWKSMRSTLSPMFTTAKMKNMFHLMNECGEKMVGNIQNAIEKQIIEGHKDGNLLRVEMKNFSSIFANDVIFTCAFGVEVNTFKNPKNEFYISGQKITDFSGRKFFISLFRFVAPYLSKKLNLQLFPEETVQFFRDLVSGSIKAREENNIVRHDMIHLLMEARKSLRAKETGDKQQQPALEGDDLTAQVVLFLLAGFDTTSTFLSFTAYELAVNGDIQRKLQQEIDCVVERRNGQIIYEDVFYGMEYLHMVVSEALRKWPPINMVDRVVSERYVIPETFDEPEVVLDKGDVIVLPIQGLHHDPKYFPNPKKFDPERFNEENKAQYQASYIPFGIGPRNCIGSRFALMEGKLCLVHLLRKFTLEIIPETQIPLKLKKGSFTKTGENGIWVGLKPR